MKARILDATALMAITPAAVRAYLNAEGWRRLEAYGKFSEVYVLESEGKTHEIIVPFTTDIGDYASAIAEVIRHVSAIEGRDELALYADLSRADRDVLRVRAPEADDDGSIGIDSGVEIVQSARDVLASAACAAIETRRAYHLGKVQQAADYMRRVRLGQTEQGSFIVTLLAPIPPALVGSQEPALWPDFDAEPYERKVTRTLATALQATHDAVIASNRGEGLAAFTNVVSKGVSANLCEALASITDQANGTELSVTWAKTRPAPMPREAVKFNRSDAELLREAGRQLRLQEPRRDERLIGYVTHLRRMEEDVEGNATLKALVDGKPRSLSVTLPPREYTVAILAHDRRAPVTLVGDIEMTGKRWRVTEARDLQILADNDDNELFTSSSVVVLSEDERRGLRNLEISSNVFFLNEDERRALLRNLGVSPEQVEEIIRKPFGKSSD
jgi:hypothetical protein